LLPLAYQF